MLGLEDAGSRKGGGDGVSEGWVSGEVCRSTVVQDSSSCVCGPHHVRVCISHT
jgi:hypothetical protein